MSEKQTPKNEQNEPGKKPQETQPGYFTEQQEIITSTSTQSFDALEGRRTPPPETRLEKQKNPVETLAEELKQKFQAILAECDRYFRQNYEISFEAYAGMTPEHLLAAIIVDQYTYEYSTTRVNIPEVIETLTDQEIKQTFEKAVTLIRDIATYKKLEEKGDFFVRLLSEVRIESLPELQALLALITRIRNPENTSTIAILRELFKDD